MSENILDDAISVIAQSETAHEAAMSRCEEVRRFIQHKQVDRGWHSIFDHAQLLSVSQHAMPDGTPLWSASFMVQQVQQGGFTNQIVAQMFLAEESPGVFVKLPPIAVLGNVPTI